jgi:hypothetical protein
VGHSPAYPPSVPERLTGPEIERRYAGEWVIVQEFVPDPDEMVREGLVVAHSPSLDDAYRALDDVIGDYAMWFVGPSSGEIVGYVGILR